LSKEQIILRSVEEPQGASTKFCPASQERATEGHVPQEDLK